MCNPMSSREKKSATTPASDTENTVNPREKGRKWDACSEFDDLDGFGTGLITAVDLDARLVLLADGRTAPITTFFDGDLQETDDPAEAAVALVWLSAEVQHCIELDPDAYPWIEMIGPPKARQH